MHVTGAKRGKIVGEKLSYYCRVKSLTQVCAGPLTAHWYSKNPGGRTDNSLRKQRTFGDATAGFLAKWRLKKRAHKFHTDDASPPRLGVANWRAIWVVLLIGGAAWKIWFNQRISALVSQTSFDGETSGSVAKCPQFSQTKEPTVFQVWENRLLYFGVVIGNLG